MRIMASANSGWNFHEGFRTEFLERWVQGRPVRLPHNAVDVPLNYFDDRVYQREFCNQKEICWKKEFEGREVFLMFDAAMANTRVFANGEAVCSHKDGYTPFSARLTGRLRVGRNLLTVKIDGKENPCIPPFGGRIDYLTFAGIYRDVWLLVTDQAWIGNIKVETPRALSRRKSVSVSCVCGGGGHSGGRAAVRIVDAEGQQVAEGIGSVNGGKALIEMRGLQGITLWDLDSPVLYKAVVDLDCDGGKDRVEVGFGFRSAEFAADGFRLNGRKLKIRGLNRHQSYPYAGYAMGRRAQERDAEILKRELKCNLVRTSHYPQSPWFLDHCDRIGLLVFEEIPGWQHIGAAGWKQESVRNVERMIQRDWNRPSVVLWGVRINESADDDSFYRATNDLARRLDSTRQTAGVRYIERSSMLEDVYTMNDFIIGQEELPWVNHHRIPLRGQSEVTGLSRRVPYLVTEFNGHMYPTKISDPEERQAEHVLRYLQVLNAAYADSGIAGCIGWCMADYNTHKDFGAGDRICHHGVLDMFRIPKFAAYVYASQGDPEESPVLAPVTFWARGERSIGGVLPLTILTNCDMVELRCGTGIVKRFTPDRTRYPHLPHAPVTVGRESFSDGELGHWGERWEDSLLIGNVRGKPVKEVRLLSGPEPARLDVSADRQSLFASETDSVRVVIRALDQADNVLPFLTDPVFVSIDGPARLIGPRELALRGGVAAFWAESTEVTGRVAVEARSPRFDPVRITLEAVPGPSVSPRLWRPQIGGCGSAS